jgi:hypothetical protein
MYTVNVKCVMGKEDKGVRVNHKLFIHDEKGTIGNKEADLSCSGLRLVSDHVVCSLMAKVNGAGNWAFSWGVTSSDAGAGDATGVKIDSEGSGGGEGGYDADVDDGGSTANLYDFGEDGTEEIDGGRDLIAAREDERDGYVCWLGGIVTSDVSPTPRRRPFSLSTRRRALLRASFSRRV